MNHQKQFKKKGGMKTEVGGDEKMKRRREKKVCGQWGSLQKHTERMKITWRQMEIVALVLIRQRVNDHWKPVKTSLSTNCFRIIGHSGHSRVHYSGWL